MVFQSRSALRAGFFLTPGHRHRKENGGPGEDADGSSMNEHRNEQHQGSRREVLTMAWPLVIGMLSYTLMGVVDTLLMGHVNTAAQAGVGLANTLFFFATSFFMGLSAGPQSLVAAADGARNPARVNQAGGAGIVVGLISGLLGVLVLGLLHKPLLHLVVTEEEVAKNACDYLYMRLYGLPFGMLAMGLISGLQGLGDTRTRMWVSVVANGVNVGLDLVLIFGFGPVPAMGAAGAALATTIASLVMAVLYAWAYLRRLGRPVLPDMEVFMSSLRLGLPSGVQRVMGVFAFTVISLVLARVGSAHLAASEIVLNIISISFLPGFGVGEASGVLVGRYLGAGKPMLAARAVGSGRFLAMVFMGLCGAAFALLGAQTAGLFTLDAEVARLAGTLMLYAAVFQVLDAVATVHLCALRGAGDTTFCLWTTIGCAWGLTVPLTLVFGLWLNWGAPGAYLGITMELLALCVITGLRVRGLAVGRVGRMDLLLGADAARTR